MVTIKQVKKCLGKKPGFRRTIDVEGIPFDSIKDMTVGQARKLHQQLKDLK